MIGILGGTFDPIHLGHTHIASQVVTRLGLEQLQFMPCALPVHRGSPHASADQRCAMIELAMGAEPRFALNRLELQRNEPSYTVDSLRRLRRQFDESGEGPRIALVLGVDAFNGFAGWKAPDEILGLAHLVVCRRPGYVVDADLYPDQRVDDPAQLAQRRHGAILVLDVDAPDCSASQVRDALRRGRAIDRFLDGAVARFIEQHNLYRNTRD